MDSTPKSKKAMTQEEVNVLINLIENCPAIRSKETNATTNKLKEEAWVKLADGFNATTGSYPRTTTQLKLKWDNLKKSARKRAQQIRMNYFKTGGGKPDFIPPDEALDRVASLLGSTCSGFLVQYGGDGTGEGSDNIVVAAEVELPDGDAVLEVPQDIQYSVVNQVPKGNTGNTSMTTSAVTPIRKHLYGMPMMAAPLKIKGKTKKEDNRSQVNLELAKYYEKKTQRTELEIDKLKLEIKLLELEVASKVNKS